MLRISGQQALHADQRQIAHNHRFLITAPRFHAFQHGLQRVGLTASEVVREFFCAVLVCRQCKGAFQLPERAIDLRELREEAFGFNRVHHFRQLFIRRTQCGTEVKHLLSQLTELADFFGKAHLDEQTQ
ncbi:hypothetical protein D3C73_1197740 [compost metagenome]